MSEHRFKNRLIKYLLYLLVLLAFIFIAIFPRHSISYEVDISSSPEKTPPVTLYIDPQALIRHYSEVYGIDPELPLRIAKCESGLNRYAKNKTSSAESYFQFINSTWYYTMEMMGHPTTTDKFHQTLSIEAGIFLLKKEGSRHWYPSEHCWNKV